MLRAKLPVIRDGPRPTWRAGRLLGLRTQVIGLIYEGLLDYRLKRTDEWLGPMVFLNIGRQPVLPCGGWRTCWPRPNGLKSLLTTLRKEQVTATAKDEEDESPEDAEQPEEPERSSKKNL